MEVIVEENFYKKCKKFPRHAQEKANEVISLLQLFLKVRLEKLMTMLMEIEEVTPEKLTKRERNHLERTSRYLREGRTDKFMSLEEFQQSLGL